MMLYTCLFHPLIQSDFNEAYSWYEDLQPGLGEKFLKAVRTSIDAIAMHPENYGTKNRKGFREVEIPFFPYLIVYKLNKQDKEIYISSIHHTKKHPGKKYRK